MFIFAIDTSGEINSLCISDDNKPIISIQWSKEFSTSKNIAEFAQFALEKKGIEIEDIDAFAISAGPGFFTGLRVGIAFAKGLAWSLNKPLFAINTLEAIASRCFDARYVSPVLNAKKGQIFCALFESKKKGLKRLTPDMSIEPALWAKTLKERCDSKVMLIGSGATLYSEIWKSIDAIVTPESICYDLCVEIAKICGGLYKKGLRPAAASVEANYIRQADAKTLEGGIKWESQTTSSSKR